VAIIFLFFIAGLWMADGLALLLSPERMIAILRQSIIVAPGFLKWGGLAGRVTRSGPLSGYARPGLSATLDRRGSQYGGQGDFLVCRV